MTKTSNNLSVREGLIEVVNAERFQFNKPRSGSDVQVVVMEKTGDSLRHYCTLRSSEERLSVGERFWGNFVCYVVHLTPREMHIEEDLATADRITNVRVKISVRYRAVDSEMVALADDALQSLREDLVTALRREIQRMPLEQVTEEYLEAQLSQQSVYSQGRLGIVIERIRVHASWPKEILDRHRAAEEAQRKQQAEDMQRRREWQLQDQQRRREKDQELQDIAHVDEVIVRLGLDGVPPDIRLYLYSLPRQEALQKIIELAQQQREYLRGERREQLDQDIALIRELLDRHMLEEQDVAGFGRNLLDRYQRNSALDETMGGGTAALFGGGGSRRLAGRQDREDPDQLPPGSDEPKKPEEETPRRR